MVSALLQLVIAKVLTLYSGCDQTICDELHTKPMMMLGLIIETRIQIIHMYNYFQRLDGLWLN